VSALEKKKTMRKKNEDYSIGALGLRPLVPTEPEQLLEMTELVPRPVLRAEVFHIHTEGATLGGLATSRECLQLHSRLPWKLWRPMLERAHNCRL
jgi:hypothetical protein